MSLPKAAFRYLSLRYDQQCEIMKGLRVYSDPMPFETQNMHAKRMYGVLRDQNRITDLELAVRPFFKNSTEGK